MHIFILNIILQKWYSYDGFDADMSEVYSKSLHDENLDLTEDQLCQNAIPKEIKDNSWLNNLVHWNKNWDC